MAVAYRIGDSGNAGPPGPIYTAGRTTNAVTAIHVPYPAIDAGFECYFFPYCKPPVPCYGCSFGHCIEIQLTNAASLLPDQIPYGTVGIIFTDVPTQ